MGVLNYMWKKLTPTRALAETSGNLELAFFESVYRVTYFIGFSSVDTGVLYLLYSGTVKIALMIFLSLELWFLCAASSLEDVIAVGYVLLINLMAVYRYWMLHKHKNTYKNLAMAMESPNFDKSTQRRQQIIEYWGNNNEKYLKFLLALGFCTLVAWYFYPLLDDIDYNLVIMIKVPYEYRNPELYGLTYVISVFFAQYSALFVMMNDFILQSYLIQLLCQFEVLGDCFENILVDISKDSKDILIDTNSLRMDEVFTETYFNRLSALVEQHELILNNTSALRDILKTPMLGQMAASFILICFTGYQLAEAISAGITQILTSVLYLSYNLLQLFILCQWCDEINVKSERIREAVYFSGWERVAMVPGVRARLMLVIARASRPLVLTAGGLYDLSLNSYASLLKAAYSAFTMLLRTRK